MPPKRARASAFPASRIKRIIQADEEVGKVAQATPIAVSKAAELFIAELTAAAQAEAQKAGSKKISPVYIKRAVESKPNFDFLKDLTQTIPDPVEGAASEKPKKRRKTKPKAEANGDDDDEEPEAAASAPPPPAASTATAEATLPDTSLPPMPPPMKRGPPKEDSDEDYDA